MENTGVIGLEELGERIRVAVASIDAASHLLLTDIRAFDERAGWAAAGAVSCAHWLSVVCRIELATAQQKVRMAHALGRLPLLDEELRTGSLSYSQVRAICRVATPENEARLIELGRGSTASQLEKICKLIDQARPPDPARDEDRRWLRVRDLDNGMVRFEAQLRPEEAARVLKACDVFAASSAERPDGLVTIADAVLRGDAPDRPPVEITMHIDAATLTGNVEGQAGLSAESARRLLCDAGVVPVVQDDQGKILDVGRKVRTFSGALRRALAARDEHTCRFPGCAHTRYLHAHHIEHWVDGGETTLDNGILVCTRHHALLHEGGFRVVRDGDGLEFLRPDGRPVVPRKPAAAKPLTQVTPPPLPWDGLPVDYAAAADYAVGSA